MTLLLLLAKLKVRKITIKNIIVIVIVIVTVTITIIIGSGRPRRAVFSTNSNIVSEALLETAKQSYSSTIQLTSTVSDPENAVAQVKNRLISQLEEKLDNFCDEIKEVSLPQ